jgi:VCBS repeat-containing protein
MGLERLESRTVFSGASPVAVNDLFHTLTDQTLDVAGPAILANDIDAEGDALAASLFSGPSHGSLSLNDDGSFQYVPESGFEGLDSFMYTASDGTGSSMLAAVTLRVGEGNAPASVDDAFTMEEGGILDIPGAAGVLANDTDADGDSLTASVVAGPINGELSLNDDGSFTYTPAEGFYGADSFSYVASDGILSGNVATVTITVNPVNAAPVATNDAYAVEEDNALNLAGPGVLENDSDADGDSLTASVVSEPLHGSLTLNADGSFDYIPAQDYHGVDGFSYVLNDGTATSNVATVTIQVGAVNDAPFGKADDFATDEDTPLAIAAGGVLANDIDVDGDPLSAVLVNGPANGDLTLNADGSFIYTPHADFFGADSFTYTAGDGTLNSGETTVTIAVNPINDAGVAVNDEYDLAEDGVLTVDATGVLANDLDAEGDPLTAALVSGPLHGELTFNADGSFVYTPEADYFGTDGFSYQVNDGTGVSAVATVTINVAAENDAPVGVADEFAVEEDGVLTVDAAGGVLANDTDAEGDALAALLVAGPTSGELTLNPDGSFNYIPQADFNGTDSFTYLASDGTTESVETTVTINVGPVNDGPFAAAEEFAVDEDGALTVDAAGGVLANDMDAEGDALSAALVTGPTSGELTLNADGSFNYVPQADFFGTDSFTYKANDGALESGETTVTITVNAVNDAPLAAADEYSVEEDGVLTVDAAGGVLVNDTDAEKDALSAILVAGPTSGELTLNPDGSFKYIPQADFNGTDSFTYLVSDGTTESVETTVTINVGAVNDGPIAQGDAYVTDEDTPLVVEATGVLGNDTDSDGDLLTTSLVTGPAGGSVELNADGSFTYTPNTNFNGEDSFTYSVSDGELSSEATVVITVNAVPDAPTPFDDAYNVGEDYTLTVDAAMGVLGNDVDPEGLTLTAELVTGPSHGELTLNADGSFSYTPEANYVGPDRFTYVANNGVEAGLETAVSILVEPLNDAPTAGNDEYTFSGGAPLDATAETGVLANDSDVEGNPLTARLIAGPQHGTLTFNADGSFNYVAEAGYAGEDSFRYQVHDGVANSNVATVTLHVMPVAQNVQPTSADDSFTVASGETLSVASPGVLANDADADGVSLTAAVVTGPAHGTLTLNGDGSFDYTPEAGYVGADAFTYQASDGANLGNVATVTIDVTAPANSRPTAANDQYVGTAGQSLVIDGPGVLANDSDPDGDALSATLFSGPEHGTVTLNSDGSFVYTPETGFSGQDSFIYQTSDGAMNSALAAVTIDVKPGETPSLVTCERLSNSLKMILRRAKFSLALSIEGANVLADKIEELGSRAGDKANGIGADVLHSLTAANSRAASHIATVDAVFAGRWWRR